MDLLAQPDRRLLDRLVRQAQLELLDQASPDLQVQLVKQVRQDRALLDPQEQADLPAQQVLPAQLHRLIPLVW